jgi:hypothetical protein
MNILLVHLIEKIDEIDDELVVLDVYTHLQAVLQYIVEEFDANIMVEILFDSCAVRELLDEVDELDDVDEIVNISIVIEIMLQDDEIEVFDICQIYLGHPDIMLDEVDEVDFMVVYVDGAIVDDVDDVDDEVNDDVKVIVAPLVVEVTHHIIDDEVDEYNLVGVILLRDGVDASEYLYYVTQLLVDII